MMNLNDMKKEVRQAMISLGYKKTGCITVTPLDDDRALVTQYPNGKAPGVEIGIYDFIKHTFVD
ncbi:MAG: hypothetical protein V3G42_15655 [Oscillospiraceae bacterium]